MKTKKRCSTCKFFKMRPSLGECRFNPPIPDNAGLGQFVKVNGESWCGQYQEKSTKREAVIGGKR